MTYVNPIPANYDSSSLNIDPGGLSSAAQAVLASVLDISNYLGAINTALSSLTLSWTGDSASQASIFNDEWNSAVQVLFGTQADPNSGALCILANGLSNAAQNYSQTEGNIAAMFTGFANGSPPSSAQSVTDSARDQINGGSEWLYHFTAVNENLSAYPAAPAAPSTVKS